jgi:hypothetical protein
MAIDAGCDDGHLDRDGCAIERGLDYNRAIAELATKAPGLTHRCASVENAYNAMLQRLRNRRAAGLQ